MNDNTNFTLYDSVSKDLLDKIATGYYKQGDKLPTVSQLCEIYNTSDATIRKSLEMLKSSGYVNSVKRIGLFVANKNTARLTFNFHEFESIKNKVDRFEILSMTRPKVAVAACEELIAGTYYKIERLYCSGLLPVLYKINYLPYKARFNGKNSYIKWIEEMDFVLDSSFLQKKSVFTISDNGEYKNKLFILPSMSMLKISKKIYTHQGIFQSFIEIFMLSSEVNIKLHQ